MPARRELYRSEGHHLREAQHATGVLALNQALVFNPAEEEAAGSTLHIGRNTAATLEGTANNELSGTNAGEEFGATE